MSSKASKISIKFYFHSFTNKSGLNALYIRVREGREYTKVTKTPFELNKAHWNATNGLVSDEHLDYETYNQGLLVYKKKMDEALAKYQSKMFTADMVFDFISGKSDATTLENYIQSHYKANFSKTLFINYESRLKGFKNVIGRTKDLAFDDINNNLVKKFKRIADQRIKDGSHKTSTFMAYLNAVLSICNEAYENNHILEPIVVSKKARKFKENDFGENPSCSTEEVKEAINNIDTIRKWEAVAGWLLMFGMRGFYPSDVVKMAENQLWRDAKNKKRMPFEKVTKNRRSDWTNGSLWLDFRRSKSHMPMFIKLETSLIQLIEKIKYSYMFTHADHKIDDKHIVTDINNRLSIVEYDLANNPQAHRNIWRNRQRMLPKFCDLKNHKTPRKTYYQLADDLEDEITAKKLVGHTTDKLSKDFYSKYNTEKQVKKLDKVHKKVMREFRFDELVSMLIKKFYELIEDGKAPKWLLKQSAVMQEGNEWKVLTGFKDHKAQFEMIPKKYKRFLDDKSINEDYWYELVEELKGASKNAIEVIYKKFNKLTQEREKTQATEIESLDKGADIEALEVKLERYLEEENYEGCALVKKQIEEFEAV